MSRQYATFDEINIGANLVLSQGDQIVQTNLSTNAHRMARSTFPMAGFQGQAEGIVYSPDLSNPSIVSVSGVPPVCFGVCTSASSFAKFVGEESTSFGYCPGDGKVYNNNAVLTTLGTCAFGDYIGIIVDPIAASMTITRNGQPIGNIALTASQSWYYAATVSGNPGSLAWYVNSGVTPIRFPSATIGGWWEPIPQITPILLATEPYITQHSDALPDTKFAGDLDRMTNPPKFQRSVQFWPWGTDSTTRPPSLSYAGTGSIQVDILDVNGIYGALETNDIRNVQVTFLRLAQGSSFGTAEQSFTAFVDYLAPVSDQTKSLYLTDLRSQLQVPMYRALFPPNVDASVAGKTRPISLGVCRNYSPTLYDTTNFYYAAHDSNLSALGTQRLAGKPMALGTDYNLLPDASGFVLTAAPTDKFTAESTSTGAAYNPGGTDILSGSGNFLSATPDSNGHPTGWYAYQYMVGSTPYWQVDATYGVLTPSADNSQQTLVRDPTAFTLASGYSYVVQVQVTACPQYGLNGRTYINPGTLTIGFAAGTVSRGFNITGQTVQLEQTGTYTVTINNNSGSALPFGIIFIANELIQVSNNLGISSIKIQQLPPVSENVPLDAINLDTILKAIMIDRGPITLAQYDPSGAQAIDAATGYGYGIHIEPTDTPQVQAVVKQILDCVCADIYQGRDGLLHVVRMIAPESVSSGALAGSLTVTDIQGYLIPYQDNAENLTTRIEGCPNYAPLTDSDLANTSLTDCPLIVRAKLKLNYQWTAVSGKQLSPRYVYAENVSALPSLFDLQANGQAEIDRVCGIYAVSPRNYYAGTFFSPLGREFEIGQVWNVTYPLPGLESGKQLMIVGLTESPSECLTDLIFWG